MNPPLRPPRLIFLLNCAQRRLNLWINALQAEASTSDGPVPTPTQAGLLFALAQADGATMGQLAGTLDLVPSAISGLVQRMEALKWVSRQPDPDDGRTQRVWLQAAGQAQLPRLKPVTARIQRQLTAGFTDEEIAIVARWLTHVQRLDTSSGR